MVNKTANLYKIEQACLSRIFIIFRILYALASKKFVSPWLTMLAHYLACLCKV